MKIAIACDHAGPAYREAIAEMLRQEGMEVADYGCKDTESVDYPEYAHYVCKAVQNKEADLGILICGTGIGMSMAANKHKGIRAAVCTEPFSTEMTRKHNDANVLCMGARVITLETAEKLAEIFVHTEFEGGRHMRRINMVNAFEESEFCGK